jgi:hypothetical protein
MKKPLSWILIGFVSLFLGACSAASLQKASDSTAVAGWMSPLGAAIHLPLSIAADIANSESTSSTELVPPGSKGETIDGKLVFVPPKGSKSPPHCNHQGQICSDGNRKRKGGAHRDVKRSRRQQYKFDRR